MTTQTMDATSLWYINAVKGHEVNTEMIFDRLKDDVPNSIAAVLERTCNIQCMHCEYQKEESSRKYSENLQDTLLNLELQLPKKEEGSRQSDPYFIHAGRKLQPWHIGLLSDLKDIRPDLKIGMIDNGTYLRNSELLKKAITFDWIDISIDGLEESHNNQRDPINRKSYANAIKGLSHAREYVTGGKNSVNVNMTITSINYKDIGGLSDLVLDKADTIHYSFMTPMNEKHLRIETDLDQFERSLDQIRYAQKNYGSEKVFFRIFRLEDLGKLAQIMGNNTLRKAFYDKDAKLIPGAINLKIDGINAIIKLLATTASHRLDGMFAFGEGRSH